MVKLVQKLSFNYERIYEVVIYMNHYGVLQALAVQTRCRAKNIKIKLANQVFLSTFAAALKDLHFTNPNVTIILFFNA